MSVRCKIARRPLIRFGAASARFGVGFLVLGVLACQDGPVEPATLLDQATASMMNSNADFQVWHQGFNHDTEGWATGADPGPFGWCGAIERVDRRDLDRAAGDIMPSAGRGYATVAHGACNEFFQNEGFLDSAPASAGRPLNETFPAAGYVNELDVYLDPSWAVGAGFGYAVSFQDLTEQFPNFHYVFLPVEKTGAGLFVAGYEVSRAGWYTFRHTFSADSDSRLAIKFALMDRGRTLFSLPIDKTLEALFPSADVSSFDVSDLGSGYVWFVYISEGLDLAIDEERLRPGR